jgi:cytochrome c6
MFLQATRMSMSCQQNNVAKVAAASAALLVAAPAFAGDFDAGEKVFNANCAACHAGGQNSVVADHTLEKAAIEKVKARSEFKIL